MTGDFTGAGDDDVAYTVLSNGARGGPGGILRLRVKPSSSKLRARLRHRVRVHGKQVYLRALIVITVKPRHGHARKVTQQLLLPI